ncbi:MAG: aldo/keto reductase [Asticcacaulis sp.]
MTSHPAFASRRLGATDVAVVRLGIGTAGIGNLYRTVSDAEASATLAAAFAAGVTYVDTAPHYGQGLAERRIGAGLHDGIVVSSKVGRVLEPIAPPPPGTERHGFIDGDPFEPVYDYSYDGVMRSFETSCQRLGRERIDILLAHDLGRVTHGDDHSRHLKAFLDGGYRAMAELKTDGRTGAVGLGVNEWQVCEEILAHADLDCVLLAGRYTLLEQTALDSFFPLCQRRGASIIAGGPYNSGILAGGAHYDYEAAPTEIVTRVWALQAVCDRHGISLAAAALQFPLGTPLLPASFPAWHQPPKWPPMSRPSTRSSPTCSGMICAPKACSIRRRLCQPARWRHEHRSLHPPSS